MHIVASATGSFVKIPSGGMNMSLLSSVTTGRQIGAQIHVVAGINGVGKTTLAAAFPNSLIMDIEKGSEHLDVPRIPASKLTTLAEFRGFLKELIETEHAHKTVTVDSVEALEILINNAVCLEGHVESIEKYDGGYGKGYTRSREIMHEIMLDFRKLQDEGITTILIAHTQVKTHNDPASNQSYDRVIMRCNDKMAAIIRDLASNVFFATYKVFTTKENNKTKAFGEGQRVMYTSWRPGFDAKNRLELPHELPLSYDAFIEACNNPASADVDEILADILAMSEKVDDKLKASVKEQIEKYKTNPEKLREIKNRLMKYVIA